MILPAHRGLAPALLVTCSLAMAATLQAQDEANSGEPEAAPVEQVDPERLEGRPVVDTRGAPVGSIEDIVMDSSGHRMAVIQLEGHDKAVMLSLDELTPVEGDQLRSTLGAAELARRHAYSPLDTAPVESELE